MYEYYKKRCRFDKDLHVVNRVMTNRANLIKEKEKGGEIQFKIDDLINEVKKHEK